MKKSGDRISILFLFALFLCNLINYAQNQIEDSGRYYKVNGITLYCEVIGSGASLVIVHGGPGLDHTYLQPQLDELAKHYRLIFYDQRGSGKSSGKVDSASMTINNFVEDLEGLRKALHIKKMLLLGHSWGGLLAMNYSIRYARRIKKLILVSPMGESSEFLSKFIRNREVRRTKEDSSALAKIMVSDGFAKRAPPVMENFARLFFKSYFYDQSKAKQLTLTFDTSTAENLLPIFSIFNKYISGYDISNELKALTCPVLILAGDHDPVPVKYAKELNSTIKNSKIIILKNCGHFPFVESKKEFISDCTEFLK